MYNCETFDSEWIKFYCIGNTGKTKTWVIVTKDDGVKLGHIKWFAKWRKYCFFSLPDCVFETTCLDDISRFIRREMAEKNKNYQHIKFLAQVDKAKEWLNANGKLYKAASCLHFRHKSIAKEYQLDCSEEAYIKLMMDVLSDLAVMRILP